MAFGGHHLHYSAVVALALIHLVQAGVEVLQGLHWGLHLVLEDHPFDFAAAAAAAASACAGALQLLVTSGSLAGLAVLAHLVVVLAAGEPLHHPQVGVEKMGLSLAVPGQAA